MLLSIPAWSQNKGIGDEEITITKERSVELQKANRVFEKIPTEEKTPTKRKMAYTFFEKKPVGIEEVEFTPNIVSPVDDNKRGRTQSSGYPNYFKIGAGNFGRFYAETFINSDQSQNLVFGVHGLHNSAKRGPIDGQNSGNSLSKIAADGKYNSNGFELKGNLGYEFRKYYFFGYDTTINFRPDDFKEQIKQTLNILNFGVTLQNTKANPIIDYAIKTNLRNLDGNYGESELEWGTQFNATFPVIQNTVTAMIEGEAYLINRTGELGGSEVKKKNLFRVTPSFNLDFNQFNAKLGFKAVNEYDQVTEINRTKGFPTVTLTYKTPGLYYFFAGYDGDIIRNTLGTMLDENPWLQKKVSINNTSKDQEYFIGSRGDLFSGLNYNLKASYGKFTGLYYFNISSNNSTSEALSKYAIFYDNNQSDFVNISAELNYQPKEFWRTNLTADYWYYDIEDAYDNINGLDIARPYHRPSFEGRWGNTFVVSDKIVSNIDFYYIGNRYAKDPIIVEDVKLAAITDLNAEFTYLFSEQFAFFVKLNNIIGKNYQRFYNYPQQGLNFLVGINVSL